MKKYIVLSGVLAFAFLGARDVEAAAYIKYDSIKGEATSATVATTTPRTTTGASGTIAPATGGQEAQTDMFLEIKGIEGESDDAKKGNVEVNWKVEEGEKGASDTNFGVLLGGGSSAEVEEARAEVAEVLREGMAEAGRPVEELSLNFEKVKTSVSRTVKLLGFIPVPARVTIEIDAEDRVKVRFPWWTFLASGADPEETGSEVFTTLSNVLKTKHDTVKNAIGNIR